MWLIDSWIYLPGAHAFKFLPTFIFLTCVTKDANEGDSNTACWWITSKKSTGEVCFPLLLLPVDNDVYDNDGYDNNGRCMRWKGMLCLYVYIYIYIYV